MPRCGRWLFTGMTCVFGSRSRAGSFGEKAAPSAQSNNAQNRSDALVLCLMREINLSRAVKLVPCSISFRNRLGRSSCETAQILEGIQTGAMTIGPARLERIPANELPAD